MAIPRGGFDGKTVYCHFSFRRPRGKDYGLFAVAFYLDKEGKELTAQATRRLKLWADHQFITAIQSYEHALYSIWTWQGIMESKGINKVMLVTDNSILAGWIEDPKKNKKYTKYMNRAVEQYRVGGTREIILGVGLCNVWNYEKAYKYCKEEKVIEDNYSNSVQAGPRGGYAINLEEAGIQYKTISQIEKENINIPVEES